MHFDNIKSVVSEINAALAGRSLGPIYQLGPFIIVIDFRSREGTHLLISVDPKSPRIHLITRKMRDLEKSSVSPSPFVQYLRATLLHSEFESAATFKDERIVKVSFSALTEIGDRQDIALLAQLTGRSANLFVVDQANVITHALRQPRGEGQQVGQQYQPPPTQKTSAVESHLIDRGNFPSLSAALDDYYARQEREDLFNSRVALVEQRLRRQLKQKEKLLENLKKDLDEHGNAEEHRRMGDLLLANIGTAERVGDKIRIRDYYSPSEPLIELDLEAETPLKDYAAKFFAKYTKAKRAGEEIKRRVDQIKREVVELERRESLLQEVKSSGDEDSLATLEDKKPAASVKSKKQERIKIPGVRRYLSSDEYEILVGRASQTNDQLTFKVAKPNDLWLHAADYPGSHVVVRNHSRKEIPHRTIIEAAQLAARFSQAGEDSKVDVNYTARKYLSKPKGAAPGLVRLSQFKTITVTPKEAGKRIVDGQ